MTRARVISLKKRMDPRVIEAKWAECKPFYEKHYRVYFRRRPKDDHVLFLYQSMQRLRESLAEHQAEAQKYLQGLGASLGRTDKSRF